MRIFLVVTLVVTSLSGCASAATDASVAAAGTDKSGVDDDAYARIAADVPTTDIWLLALTEVLAGAPAPAVKNLTRRRGYDNQPAFNAQGERLYFTSIRDGRQADIFVYSLDSGETRQVTATPESEYSPTPLAGGGFSCVRVALDGTQRLWRYGADGEPGRAVFEEVTGVGYHAWLSPQHAALFIVSEPLSLVIAGPAGVTATVADDIGRSLHALRDGSLAYVHKAAAGDWRVMRYDPASGESTRLAATPAEVEDMVWLADGSALMANARTIYRLAPGAGEFVEVADLSRVLAGDVTRMAVDPANRWLAVVVSQAEGVR